MIFIVSMHRSGSSFLASLLAKSGLNIGSNEDLISAVREDNPAGYWERKDVVKVNNVILDECGHHHLVPNLAAGIKETPSNDQKIAEVVTRLDQQKIDFIKDPRLCLTLNLWTKYFCNPRIIFISRDPTEVAMSLYKRHRMPLAIGQALWEYNNINGLTNLQGKSVLYLQHSALMSEPLKCLEKINIWLSENQTSALTIDPGVVAALYQRDLNRNRKNEIEASLTKAQKTLADQLVTTIFPDVSGHDADSMIAVLTSWKEFVERGFDPRSGRWADRQLIEDLKYAKQEIKVKDDEISSFKYLIGSFLRSRVGTAASQYLGMKARLSKSAKLPALLKLKQKVDE